MKYNKHPRTLITKAPLTREEVLTRIDSYLKITGLMPERILFARDDGKPVEKSVVAYILHSIDGEFLVENDEKCGRNELATDN